MMLEKIFLNKKIVFVPFVIIVVYVIFLVKA